MMTKFSEPKLENAFTESLGHGGFSDVFANGMGILSYSGEVVLI